MSVDEFVKLALGLSLAISILGISIQLMRLFGTLNDTLRDFRFITHKIEDLLTKFDADYYDISSTVKGITKPIQKITDNVLNPLIDASAFVGGFINIAKNKFAGQEKSEK